MQNNSPSKDITSVLADVASSVVGQFDMEALLNKSIDSTMNALNAEVCSIFLEDKENYPGVLKCVAGSGFAEKIVGKAKYSVGEGFTGSIAKSGKDFNIKSRYELENLVIGGKKIWEGKFDGVQWYSGESEFRNCIGLPLKIKDQILGVIKVENKIGGDHFSNEDLINFKTITNVIALTIENVRLHRKAEEQSKKIPESLSQVAGAVVGHFNMRELLDQIINTTLETLNAEICSIFLEDKEKNPGYVKCVAGAGFDENLVDIAEYKIGEGFTGGVVKSGKEFNIRFNEETKDFEEKGMWKNKYDHLQYAKSRTNFKNLIAVPLKIKDQILGVIKVENKIAEKSFSDEELTVLKTIANVIALTIENLRLHRKTEEQFLKTEEQSKAISFALADVAKEVVGQFNMEALLDKVINITMKTLQATVCSIFLEDREDEPGVLKCVAGSGFAKKIVDEARYNIGEGFTGSIAKSGKEFNIKTRKELENLVIDGQKVWRGKFDGLQWSSRGSEFRNCIALPLRIKDQILGVIKVENKKVGDHFTDEDLTLFRTIANVIGLTIENVRLHRKTEEQSKIISAALADIAEAVVGQFDMEALLKQIINTTMETLNAEVSSIFLEDRENEPGVIKCVAGSGFAKKIVDKAKYKSGEGLTGSVFKHGIEYNSTKEEHRQIEINGKCVWKGKFDDAQWQGGESEFRNGIGLPLKIKDDILGVIKVENKLEQYGDRFTDDDLTIFRTIANVIALTIENVRLHRKAEEQSNFISSALADIAKAVVGQFEREALLNQIINTTMETLHAEVCSIFLEDRENEAGIVKCVAGSGHAKKIVNEARYKIGEGLTGAVFKYGEEYNCKNRKALEDLLIGGTKVWKGKFDNRQWPSGTSEFRNGIGLPLKIKDETLGIIKVENKRKSFGDFFTNDDFRTFKTIADVIALAIENARLHKRIEDQLKTIATKAAHRVNNQVIGYEGLELDIDDEINSAVPSKPNLNVILERLKKTTKNLKTLINEFKNYGKPIELEKTTCDINNIIKDEIWYSRPPDSINISLQDDKNIPTLNLDSARFAEGIKELLSNSKRAIEGSTNRGNIIISTRLQKDADQEIDKNVLIILEDDGPGFPKDFPVFTPFSSTNPSGTGLGLVTVKEVIEAHGGSIQLMPKEKPGAKFQILIPI